MERRTCADCDRDYDKARQEVARIYTQAFVQLFICMYVCVYIWNYCVRGQAIKFIMTLSRKMSERMRIDLRNNRGIFT